METLSELELSNGSNFSIGRTSEIRMANVAIRELKTMNL